MMASKQERLPREFNKISFSNLFAQLSEQLALVGALMYAAIYLNASVSEISFLQLTQTLPFLLMSIPAGLLVDRLSRTLTMLTAEVLRALSLVLICFFIFKSSLSIPVLAVLGFIGATSTVVYSIAVPSLVPALVPKHNMAIANGRVELARCLALAIGPTIAGYLIAHSGVSVSFVISVVFSMIAFILILNLKEPPRVKQGKKHILSDLKVGALFVARNLHLRQMLYTSIVFNISWFILQSIYIIYAMNKLNFTTDLIGSSMGVYGIGMVAGAVIMPFISRRLSFGTLLKLGPTSALFGAVLMAVTLFYPSYPIVILSYFFFGVGPIIWTISSVTLRQAITPENMLGRVSSLVMMATFGARPIGAALGGVLGTYIGIDNCIWVVLIGFLIQFIIIYTAGVSKLASLESLPEPIPLEK
ncbi:MFS transporter [Erwinia rhapontici]|uniref:MFS transporter n=1 Tax=Erwinia rhapontici TaxID=55212 RepID=UPI003D3700F8